LMDNVKKSIKMLLHTVSLKRKIAKDTIKRHN
jgi:hypothetical protein